LIRFRTTSDIAEPFRQASAARWLGAVLFVLPLMTAQAGSVERGQLLYENHCLGCHESTLHVRERRKVQSLDALRGQVLLWAGETGLSWRADDIDDVAAFLDTTFYRFATAP
jgi:hypothetical protein